MTSAEAWDDVLRAHSKLREEADSISMNGMGSYAPAIARFKIAVEAYADARVREALADPLTMLEELAKLGDASVYVRKADAMVDVSVSPLAYSFDYWIDAKLRDRAEAAALLGEKDETDNRQLP